MDMDKRQVGLRETVAGVQIQALLEELDGALDDLQLILGPVLRPQGPAPALRGVDPEPATELAALLGNVSARLHRAVMFARDLADRVDL